MWYDGVIDMWVISKCVNHRNRRGEDGGGKYIGGGRCKDGADERGAVLGSGGRSGGGGGGGGGDVCVCVYTCV